MAEKGENCRKCAAYASCHMGGCTGVLWNSNSYIHPSTKCCLKLIWDSSPSQELKANTAQGTA